MTGDGDGGKPPPTANDLRRSVHEQAARAERLIRALTRDLEAERDRSRALAQERDRLLVEVAKSEASRVQLHEHAERLERTLLDLDRERRRLVEADARLRAELEAEREVATRQLRALEERVEELSATVALLVGDHPSGEAG